MVTEDRPPVTMPRCPCCRGEPGEAASTLAPAQVPCPDPECPVVTWRTDRRPPGESPGSYLPRWSIDP